MACVWIEGFETHINLSQLARKYATMSGSMSSTAGRVFGVAGAPLSAVMVTPSFGTDNTMVLGFGFRFTSHNAQVNSGAQGLYFETGANEQCHLEWESGSGLGTRFLLKRGSTTVATSSYFDFGVWHYIELKLTVRDGTDGAYELRHNGVLDISGASVNLADNATDGWDVFAFRFTSNLSATLRLDDLYLCDGTTANNNDFLGPSIVEGLLPNADSTPLQWTQNGTGDHYTSINDAANLAPDEVTTGGTIGSDTNGQQDFFDFEDLAQITGTIHAVQIGVQLGMAAAGTRTVRTVYKDPDTTEVDNASHVVDSTAYDEFTEVLDRNPNGGGAWDVTDIDDGEWAVEVVS